MAENACRRVFFALWPDARARDALDGLARRVVERCGGRRIPRDNLHLTLAFIGAVPPERIEVLREIAGTLDAEAFDLRLDRLGCWPRNRILWAGCGSPPPGQRRLCAALTAALAAAGFALDQRPQVPHLTLARQARCENLPEFGPPVGWQVGEFALVESTLRPAGARYAALERWPLRPAAPGRENPIEMPENI